MSDAGAWGRWERIFPWMEAELGGRIVRRARQGRESGGRPAWFVDLDVQGESLRIQQLEADVAGGRLRVSPLVTRLSDQRRRLNLEIERLDLAQLLTEVPLEDLQLTGQVSGRLPLQQEGTRIRIEQGRLAALGPGTIRYGASQEGVEPSKRTTTQPNAVPPVEGGMNLLLRALEDFHYSELEARIDGQTGEDLSLKLSIQGANPALYDGYPIRLNVNVTGALDEILRSGLDTSRIGREAGDLFRFQP